MGKYSKQKCGVSEFMFILDFKKGKGQKLRRNIKILGGVVILTFAFRKPQGLLSWPNVNYGNSLKALCVLSRMPASSCFSTENTLRHF